MQIGRNYQLEQIKSKYFYSFGKGKTFDDDNTTYMLQKTIYTSQILFLIQKPCFKWNIFFRILLFFKEKYLIIMIVHHLKQRQSHTSSPCSIETTNKKFSNQQRKFGDELHFYHQENSSKYLQAPTSSICQIKTNQRAIKEIMIRTRHSDCKKIHEQSPELYGTNQFLNENVNKPRLSPIIQSQPTNLQSKQQHEPNHIKITQSANLQSLNSNQVLFNNMVPRLLSPQHHQSQRRNHKSSNPLKKLFSYCFGMRQNREAQNTNSSQNRENRYEIRDTNGHVVNFNVQDSDLLGPLLGVVAAMDSIDLPKKKSPGLDDQQIEKFQLFKINSNLSKIEDTCPICCNQFKQRQEVLKLPCKHLYHKNCIKKWLHQSPVCPICKRNLKSSKQ